MPLEVRTAKQTAYIFNNIAHPSLSWFVKIAHFLYGLDNQGFDPLPVQLSIEYRQLGCNLFAADIIINIQAWP